MNIVVDIRSLMHGRMSGVEIYVRNLLCELFLIDTENQYILYYNSFRDVQNILPRFDFPNVTIVKTKIPNKLLNLCFSLFRYPKIDQMILRRGMDIDLVFIPDPRPSPCSVRKIVTFHDLSFARFPQHFTLKTRLWHRILRPRREALEADHMIAVSDATKHELMKEYDIDASRITVVPHGVDERFALPIQESEIERVRLKYDLPQQYFFSLSTLEPRKNIRRLIEAFCMFREKIDAPLTLLIGGMKNNSIFRDVSFPLDDRVRFLGFIDEADKPALYRLSRGFLFPSLYEGFGLPVLEAMKSGVPVLISDIPSLRSLVGENGIFVDPEQVSSIADGILKLMKSDYQYARELRERAERFSWKKTAQQTLEVFRKCHSGARRKFLENATASRQV